MHRRLAVVCLVVLAGCTAPFASGPAPDSTATAGPNGSTDAGPPGTTDAGSATNAASPSPTPTRASPTRTPHPPGDPPTDVLGWENGTWYDEAIAVDASDGLNDTEVDLVVARTMARVEVLRGLEFNESVRVEFRPRSSFTFRPEESRWREQYWEMLFVVNEAESTVEAYAELYRVVVDGLGGAERIVLFVEDPDAPRINRNTLAHELVHAVEHQHDVYPGRKGRSRDAANAHRALVEGSAIYYEQRYAARCRSDWSCLELPPRTAVEVGPGFNRGLYVDFAMAYSVGGRFVTALHERGGEAALARARREPPASTEQIIHPERYPDETPVSVTVPDRSSEGWERLSRPNAPGAAGTVGEARLFAMFWVNDVPPNGTAAVNRAQQVDLRYSHPSTDGWAGDAFVPYASGSQTGYVLETVWDSEADAREFAAAYRRLLRSRNATAVGPDRFRLPRGDPFADAFRVTRQGRTVVVVNAPTVDQLDDVHRPRD